MNDLKDRLIRLGSENPELQRHIRPVLDRISSEETWRVVAVLQSDSLSGRDLVDKYVRSGAGRDIFGDHYQVAKVENDKVHLECEKTWNDRREATNAAADKDVDLKRDLMGANPEIGLAYAYAVKESAKNI
jgi:hypothetical protein